MMGNNEEREASRESFVFYRSFQNAIDEARPEEQLQIYRAIALYALDGVEPELTGLIRAVWLAIKPQLQANWKRYKNGCRGGRFGRMGGAPKGNTNASKQPQNNPKTTPNVNDNVNVNDNDNVNVNESKTKRAAFFPPSLEEVEVYVKENGLKVDAAHFIDYYAAQGWRLSNGNKMKDWKAAARSWSKREQESPKKQFQQPAGANKQQDKAPRRVNDQWQGFELPTE